MKNKKNSTTIKKVSEKVDLIIKFADKTMADHFATWLCESGEQAYWDWMTERESSNEGDITAVSFNYHGENDSTEFMKDNTIRTVAGRLDDSEE